MPKYDVQVKNPTSNNPPSDSTLREAFTDQGKELDEKLSGLPYGNLESLRNRSYVMEEDGIIRKANDYMIGDMVTAARDNRLFMLDSLDALRQIGLENIDGEINITVSDPIKDAPRNPPPSGRISSPGSTTRKPKRRSKPTRKRKPSRNLSTGW